MNLLGKKEIQEIRNDIYLGKGYFILRNYINPIQVDHIVQFWKETNFENTENYQKFRDLHYGKSDFSIVSKDSDCHYNFFGTRLKTLPRMQWRGKCNQSEIKLKEIHRIMSSSLITVPRGKKNPYDMWLLIV